MGQKYAGFNSPGTFIGFYDSEDSPLPGDLNGIEISDVQWMTFLTGVNSGQVLQLSASGVPELVAAPPPTGADLLSINTAAQAKLMATANAATFGMSNAYVAGLLDAADTATFKAWAQYQLELSKVDLTQQAPAWPALPSV